MRSLCSRRLTGTALALASLVFAQPVFPQEDADAEDEYFALVGGDVYTGTGALMRGVTIVSKNGKITEIGHDPYIPDDAEILDVTGMRVYPGLVAIGATTSISGGLFAADDPLSDEAFEVDQHPDPHGGLDTLTGDEWQEVFGDSFADGADDFAAPSTQDTQAEGARNQIEDSFDPFSQYLVLALATGITSAEQGDAAIKLRRGEIDGILMNEKNLVAVGWSTPGSIRGTREKFAKAAEYLRKLEAYQGLDKDAQKEQKEPSKKGIDAGILRILTGQKRARFNANDRDALAAIATFARAYHFRPVIYGCREGWTVADQLGRAGAYAVITPRDRGSRDERVVRPGGSSIENAAILHASGVQVAIKPGAANFNLGGMTGRDLLHLPVEAGFGVRGGLSQAAALDAITIVPARILGVDHLVGSLEVGKDMDAIVTDGDILHYQTFVQWAVVAGKLAYDKQEEIFFAHIRPRAERAPEPADEEAASGDDPGETEGEESEEEPEDEDEAGEEEASEEDGDEEAEDGGR